MTPPAYAAGPDPYGGKLYRGYVLALFAAVNFFYFLDRNVLLVTQELIKTEFRLSDTQVGLLVGTVYAASFAVAGPLMGWAVDRVSRRRFLAVVVMIWSSLTALCGLAQSYAQLTLARVGLAAAESGGSPAVFSIISDVYPPERRSSPGSIFYMGSAIGIFVSFLVGGAVATEHGWRVLFILYGAPGVVLGLLLLFTLREPQAGMARDTAHSVNLMEGLRLVLGDRALVAACVGAGLYTLSMGALGAWMMPFLMRVHGLDLRTGGFVIAGTLGIAGLVGALGFGWLADHARRTHPGGQLRVVALAALLNLGFGLAAVLAEPLWLTVTMLCGWGATTLAYSGPTNAAISQRAPNRARGLAFALYAVFANLIGSGLGPLAAGFISDLAAASWGRESIRPALVLLLTIQLATAAVYMVAASWMRRPAKSDENTAFA